jgi:hypothetical protein
MENWQQIPSRGEGEPMEKSDGGGAITYEQGSQQRISVTTGKSHLIRLKKGRKIAVMVMFDPGDPKQQDDSATLKSSDGAYSKQVLIKDGEDIDGGKRLIFEDVHPDKVYSLQIDPGAEGEPFFVFRNINVTEETLKRIEYQG